GLIKADAQTNGNILHPQEGPAFQGTRENSLAQNFGRIGNSRHLIGAEGYRQSRKTLKPLCIHDRTLDNKLVYRNKTLWTTLLPGRSTRGPMRTSIDRFPP